MNGNENPVTPVEVEVTMPVLATPNAPTITFVGSTSGSPTWSYKLVAYDQFGFETLPSPAGTITSSNPHNPTAMSMGP